MKIRDIITTSLALVLFLFCFMPALAGEAEKANIFMTGHSHIDPVWRWDKQEGFQEVFASFQSVLDRMKENSEVTYVSSSAQFYEWVEKNDPGMFSEIKQRIREGRWSLVGGWWIEPDINCPSGESLVRQGLYGQRYFLDKFGLQASAGFNPDSFGHPYTLPQILRGQGLSSYFFMRPGQHEKTDIREPIFNWKGLDGTEILSFQILNRYNADAGIIEKQFDVYSERFSRDQPGVNDWMIFFGVGNHGGGPTREAMAEIAELQDKYPGLVYLSLEDYVKRIKSGGHSFPVIDDELQHHARGCYSACADVKMWNYRAENALIDAEKIASAAVALTGTYSYPQDSLRESWKKVLFNQFHDIMAGSSLEQGYVDAGNEYGYALSAAYDVKLEALHHLAAGIKTTDENYPVSLPFLVFNQHSWPVKTMIEFEAQKLSRDNRPTLRDEKGLEIPFQEVRTGAAKVEDRRVNAVFEADLPAFGYRLFRFESDNGSAVPEYQGSRASEWSLDNEYVRVEFDPSSGLISSYFDKKSGRELAAGGMASGLVLEDWDDTWGHKIVAYDRELGSFSQPEFRILEDGPERARIEITTHFGESFLRQRFSLDRNSAALTSLVTVNWNEKYRVFKLSFPTVLSQGSLATSIPYGVIEREMSGDEEPGQTWIDVSGSDGKGEFGVALFTEGKCSYSAKDGDLRVTVFHSTAWSHHNPSVVSEADGYRFMEQGIHEFKYRIYPHQGDWRNANLPRRSREFAVKPAALVTNMHDGNLPVSRSLISSTAENLNVSVLKLSEDGGGWVLRCVETQGRSASGLVKVDLLGRSLEVEMSPWEIATFYLPKDKSKSAEKVNLLEIR
jgi:alpha-mannosidase